MVPALYPGEWALAVLPRALRPGDVVVVRQPDRPGYEMVKRLAALPGQIDPAGRLLGRDEWFVTGDAPEASTDSRYFGPVPGGAIAGRVVLVYWPPGRWRTL